MVWFHIPTDHNKNINLNVKLRTRVHLYIVFKVIGHSFFSEILLSEQPASKKETKRSFSFFKASQQTL